MMKRSHIPILILFAFFVCLASGCGDGQDQQAGYKVPEKTYFRNTCWGMTKDHVKAVEEAELIPGDETMLRYRCRLEDRFDCELFYLFDDENLLVAAGYQMNAEENQFGDESEMEIEDEVERRNNNRRLTVDFYLEYQTKLTGEFGDPVSYDINWYSEDFTDTYKDDIRDGYAHNALFLTTRWNTAETIISEELTQGTFKVAYMKRQ